MARYVGGIGPKDADVVILGEAPGRQEDKQGKPFVGRSGKLLTRLLHKAGILRESCYITNVVKERPPGNNIKKFIDLSGKSPNVSPEGNQYLRTLGSELSSVDPNVILAVGNTPLWALTRKKGITKWRGSILESKLGHKVVPTIHPAAALRQYIYRYYILFDMKRLRSEMDSPYIDRPEREYILKPTVKEATTYLNNCLKHDLVAVDIEVSNRQVSCISFSYDPSHAISIPFMNEDGQLYFTHEQEKHVWLKIAEVLESEDTRIIAQNATFDTTFLYRTYGIKTSNVEDTMIAQGLLYPDFDKDLGFITTQYTEVPYYKDEGKEAFKAQNSKKFWLYNAKDSIVLTKAFPAQHEELSRMDMVEVYEKQRDLIEPLVFMAEHGMRLDLQGMREESERLSIEIAKLERDLTEATGHILNPRSPTQLKEFFYGDGPGQCGIKPYKNRSTGKPTTNEKALKRIASEGGRGNQTAREAARIILKIRKISKFKGTYLDMDVDKDERLRSSMNPIGTTSGRLSSSQTIFGTGSNVQNLPPDMKEFILPDEGYVMYEIDLGQAENRVVGYIAPDVKMIRAFNKGIDIHSQTAALIFDMSIEEVMHRYERYKQGERSEETLADIGQGDKPHRAWGKQANHAFNYDMGYRKAAFNWEIAEPDAKFIYNEYHKAYPGVRKMHRWIDESLNENRTVENLFGRKRRFLGRWNKVKKDAYAFVPQSTVADIINRYGVCGIYYNQDRFGDVTLLNQVHDSVWFQIPLSLGWQEHARLLAEIAEMMEPQLSFRGRDFTIPAEITILPKNAKQGHEFGGRPSATQLEEAYNSITKEEDKVES